MKNKKKMNYIIMDTIAVADNEDIAGKYKLLPDTYSEALALRFGFDDYDPIDEREIAEDFKETYKIPMSESLVSGIINDALHMVNHEVEIFPEINIKDVLPGGFPHDLKYAKLYWDTVINFLKSYRNEDELDEALKRKYGDMDCVIVPGIDDIYYTFTRKWDEIDIWGETLTLEEILDFRGVAEFIIEKLDEMGICVVSDIIHRDMIRPSDIYKYAYLNTDLAMKVIHGNPLKLMEKLGQLR